VLPLPPDLTPAMRRPVEASTVEPWVEAIARLAFDEPFYQDAVARTREAARMYDRDALARRYADFFVKLLAAPAITRRP
jgi:hypothetical protein